MSRVSQEEPAGRGKLGMLDAVSIIVGIVIGTTIYKMPTLVFSNTADPMWGLLVWVIGGLIALIGAYCYAELGSTYPKAGGDYFYLSRAFGPGTGFLFGWAQMTVVMPASIGVMAYVFADYIQQGFKEQLQSYKILAANGNVEFAIGETAYSLNPYFTIAAVVVLFLTLTNILGVIVGKTLQNLLTLAKVLGLGSIIFAGFFYGAPDAWEYTKKEGDFSNIDAVALIFVLYAFGGWNDSAFVAAEVRNPKRNVPRALFTGVAIVVVVYIAVNAAYINGLGWQDVTQFGPKDVPTRLIERTPLGAQGGQAMCALIMISALGACNGLIFTGPRVYAAVGAEHGIFGWMGRWRPGRGTPITALLVQAVLTVFIVAALTTKEGHEAINSCLAKTNELLRDLEQDTLHYQNEWKPNEGFDTLVARTAPVFWAFFMLTGLSLFVLREKYKDVPRPYSVPWYPLVPFLFVNACAWMLYRSIIYVEWHALFAVVIVLLGIPLYGLSRLISGPPDMTLGDEYTPQPPSPGSIQQAETKLRRSWR